MVASFETFILEKEKKVRIMNIYFLFIYDVWNCVKEVLFPWHVPISFCGIVTFKFTLVYFFLKASHPLTPPNWICSRSHTLPFPCAVSRQGPALLVRALVIYKHPSWILTTNRQIITHIIPKYVCYCFQSVLIWPSIHSPKQLFFLHSDSINVHLFSHSKV